MSLRLRHRIGEAIRAHAMWQPGEAVAVAVSGGLDSVALLDLLRVTERWHGGRLQVVTVDHGTREGSAADAAFVADLASSWGLACAVVRVDVPAPGGEAELRAARYAALEAQPAARIALAHHRDDLAETVLLQLLRGTGTAGLAGIRPVRGRYVRPLLGVEKRELRRWAELRGLAWREDPTNADPRYTRNRVRADVLPLLEAVRPGAIAALARSAEIVAKDDEWLEAHVLPGPPWPVVFVGTAPEPIVRRSLLRGVDGLEAGSIDAVIAAARRGRGGTEIRGGWIGVDGDLVVFTCTSAHPSR